MINIKFHGALAKKYGDGLKLNIRNLRFLMDAIDSNKRGFKKEIVSMERNGLHYAIIVGGKTIKTSKQLKESLTAESIDIVPIISGRGIGVAIAGFAIAATATVGTALFSIGLAIGFAGLTMALAPKPEAPKFEAQEIATRGFDKSFSFANKSNLATQGQIVPLAYGRLKIGTNVIQNSLRVFPQNVAPTTAMRRNSYDPYADIGLSDSQSLI